jgi:membrane-associated phospholipid phosphatase
VVILFLLSTRATAQTLPSDSDIPSDPQASATPPNSNSTDTLEKKFFKNLLDDQRAIWTSPFHLHKDDAKWGIPLLISTGTLWATDRHTSGELVENGDNQNRLRISHYISQLGAAYTTGSIAASFYLVGRASHDARARETGVLAAEALVNSTIMVEALKTVSQRQRPPQDDSSGEFFDGGSSFPSGHAIGAWSVATVIAEEYGQHRPLVRFAAYGLATAVGISRYTGREHFLSDVLVGSAMGYGIGRCVYIRHHDRSLDSPNEKQTTDLFHAKLFSHILPLYNPRNRVYGVTMSWEL